MSQRIFVTGASGYLGSAIAARLTRAGHEVYGLTRRSEAAEALDRMGVKPVIGDLAHPSTFLGALKNSDAAVHAAIDPQNATERDQAALEAFRGAALDGRLRRLLYTSNIWVYGDTAGQVVDEGSPLRPIALARWRVAHEEVALDLADDEVEAVVLRVGIVYGESRGIISGYFSESRASRTVTVPGSGGQHWVMLHRDDLADAYRLALEYARGGERYVLADESRLTVVDIATAVARATGAKVKRREPAAVLRERGPYGAALLLDQKASAGKARRELGWVPRHASFVNEVETLYGEWQAGQKTAVS